MSKNFENGYISIIFAKNENLLRVSENRTSLDDVREKKGIAKGVKYESFQLIKRSFFSFVGEEQTLRINFCLN